MHSRSWDLSLLEFGDCPLEMIEAKMEMKTGLGGVKQLKLLRLLLLASFLVWFLLLCFESNSLFSPPKPTPDVHLSHFVLNKPHNSKLRSCSGRYIYVHALPSKFNADIINDCSLLIKWSETDMCDAVSNTGMGPRLSNSGDLLGGKSWFATHQFLLEPIFHGRMNKYECLTNDSSVASAVYVPFYPGLDVGRYLWGFNASMKDAAAIEVFKWLRERAEWKKMQGRDHFFVVGRTTWDFRRLTNDHSDWGNRFMYLPEAKNVTVLSIESSPWGYRDFAIPYPTYFHPCSDREVFQWQVI